MRKPKKQYPENFRNLAGFSTVVFSNVFATTVLGIFMMFLTDYSGIDSAIGKVGFAAAFGTVFLLITRIVDAIDDPVQGWIMDNAKERKFGKYRLFGILGTVMVTVGVIMLFAIPAGIKSNAVGLWIWTIIGYLVMETGSAMAIALPILQKSTTDAKVRTKITAVIRFAMVVAAVPSTFFVTIVAAVNGADGNLGATATKVAVIFALVFALITFIGIALIKEPFHPAGSDDKKKNTGAGGMGGKITPSSVLVLTDGEAKVVNVNMKNQDSLSKIIDMVPGVVDKIKCKKKEDSKEETEVVDE